MSQPCRLVVFFLAILLTPMLLAQAGDSVLAQAGDSVATQADAPAVVASDGAALFDANCTQCHQVHRKVIGPALAGINDRQTETWLIPWIKNSQKVIASGDEYANKIYEEYGKTQMQAFHLTDDEIRSILAYIDTVPVPQEEVAAVISDNGATTSSSSGYLAAVLVLLVVVLILILVLLGLIVSVLTRYLKGNKDLGEADEELVTQRINLEVFLRSNAFVGLVVFIFTAVALKTLVDGAFTIGVQQGYQPTQPINFSHQIHAGQYKIDCNYCHTGVRKSRSANIPSANICMNCHIEIKKESAEIQKIYAAIDYNSDTQAYGTNTKPIEWVRVHNLPDLAYFNHSQHVGVAEIACQTCHGPVEEMDVVYQYSNLTMGWCINCHRETDINTKGNGYYSKLVKLRSEKSKEPMKVEDNGGLECAKCHY